MLRTLCTCETQTNVTDYVLSPGCSVTRNGADDAAGFSYSVDLRFNTNSLQLFMAYMTSPGTFKDLVMRSQVGTQEGFPGALGWLLCKLGGWCWGSSKDRARPRGAEGLLTSPCERAGTGGREQEHGRREQQAPASHACTPSAHMLGTSTCLRTLLARTTCANMHLLPLLHADHV